MLGKGMIGIKMRDDGLGKGITNGPDKVRRAIMTNMEYWAPRIESHMKNKAPWTDRTGNARNGLAARSYRDRDEFGIVLYHQVPYGIWLETRWSGRYAIIDPTLASQGPRVMGTLTKILNKIGFQ